jgi:ribonuclease P protein component
MITPADFKRVYGRGRRLAGEFVLVVVHPRQQPGHRLGLSVSRDHGRAVRRNKIRRILREAFRLERPTLPGQYDVVLIPRTPGTRYPLAALRRELATLIARIDAGEGRVRGPRRGSPR